MTEERQRASVIPCLSIISAILALVLVLVIVWGFGLGEELLPKGLKQAKDLESAALATTRATEQYRLAALFFGTVVAFLFGIIVAVRIIFLRHDDRAEVYVPVLLTGVVGVIGAVLDGFDLWTWGQGQGFISHQEYGIQLLRNVLAWLLGAATLGALFVLAERHYGTTRQADELQRLRDDTRACRNLLTIVAIALGLGVAQVSALYRNAIVGKIALTNGLLEEVLIPQHLNSFVQAITLAAGILFSTISALCFLPTLWILEKERVALFDKTKSKELSRSVWMDVRETTAILIPLVSGIAFIHL